MPQLGFISLSRKHLVILNKKKIPECASSLCPLRWVVKINCSMSAYVPKAECCFTTLSIQRHLIPKVSFLTLNYLGCSDQRSSCLLKSFLVFFFFIWQWLTISPAPVDQCCWDIDGPHFKRLTSNWLPRSINKLMEQTIRTPPISSLAISLHPCLIV